MFGISSEERAKIREVKNKFHTRSLVEVIQRLNYARFMSKMCYKNRHIFFSLNMRRETLK